MDWLDWIEALGTQVINSGNELPITSLDFPCYRSYISER